MRTGITRIIAAICLMGWGTGSSPVSEARGEDRLEWLYQGRPLDHWTEQLRAEQADQRQQAVAAVGAFLPDQPKQVRPLLIGMFDDPSAAVREAAVRQLSWTRGRPRPDGREVVIEALTQRLIDPAEEPQVRRAAARGLGNLEIAGAEALAAAIGRIDDAEIRAEAIEQLSRMPHDLYEEIAGMAPVRKALEQLARERPRSRTKRGERSALLRNAVERVKEPQARADALRRLEAADRIGGIVVERLVREVNRNDATAIVRMSAMQHLLSWSDHKAADGAVEALAAALESKDDRLRFWAASALAAIDPLSEAGNRAINFLVDHFLREIRRNNGVGEELSWKFLFATAQTVRRDDIFERTIAQLDNEDM
ncbi:MAG: sister chromatid cohesion protein PDS5, partial [Planctomycetaceae bacterium]